MSPPASTVPGDPLLVADSSANRLTSVGSVSLSFDGFGSVVDDVTEAVLFTVVPLAAPGSTLTTSSNVAPSDESRVDEVAWNVPVPPTAGVVSVNAGPPCCVALTNVVPGGSVSLRSTLWASFGPVLFSTSV